MMDYVPEVNHLVSPILGKAMIKLPPRADDARGGTEIGQVLRGLMGQPRDEVFISHILAGNLPDAVRNLVPVTVMANGNTLQYYVSSDVLSVGGSDDYLRISLNGKSAKKMLDQIDCTMPTKKMCDDIWRLADLKLNPRPMGASKNMMDTPTLVGHNLLIDKEIAGRPFTLLTGHKKDTVICKHLLDDRSRTAIYGWFNPSTGQAIQGPGVQSSAHSWDYQDYSQAIRLVSRRAQLNNQPIDLYDVLNDPQYSYLISEEGPYNASTIYT
jgi:hypothetical protein